MAADARTPGAPDLLDRPRVTTPAEAEAVVSAVLAALDDLREIITLETALMREGAIGQALSHEAQKADRSGRYMRGLEIIKANAVALARFAPARVSELKRAHGAFAEALAANQAVLATARAVSETILRDLAREAGREAQPQGYGRTGYGTAQPVSQRTAAMPIMVSKSL